MGPARVVAAQPLRRGCGSEGRARRLQGAFRQGVSAGGSSAGVPRRAVSSGAVSEGGSWAALAWVAAHFPPEARVVCSRLEPRRRFASSRPARPLPGGGLLRRGGDSGEVAARSGHPNMLPSNPVRRHEAWTGTMVVRLPYPEIRGRKRLSEIAPFQSVSPRCRTAMLAEDRLLEPPNGSATPPPRRNARPCRLGEDWRQLVLAET